MKKIFALLALVLGVVSCQTEPEGLDVNVGGEQEVMLTVSLPETTRANSANGFDLNSLADPNSNYSLRYILEVYRVNDDAVLYDTCQRFVETSKNTSMVFPVRLAPGYDYRIVAWTDIVEGDSKEDRYYYTEEGLDNVVIKDNGTVNWNAMDETRDAYTHVKFVDNFSSSSNLDMTLTRPFAKLRVVATDIDDIRRVGLVPTTATVEYSQDMYFKYNAVADIENKGAANDARAKSHNISYPATPVYEDATGEMTLFADYIFVPSKGIAKFNLTVKDADGNTINKEIGSFNTDIPVKRNNLTTIKGDVLTVGGNVEVTIDERFDGNIDFDVEEDTITTTVNINTSAELVAALQTAVAAGETNIVFDAKGANIGNFNKDDNTWFTTNLVPTGVTVTLRNATVSGISRWNNANGTLIFENCTFTNNSAYSINFAWGNGHVKFTNCELYGWCSFDGVTVEMNDCNIAGNGRYALVRSKKTFTMNNCTIDGSNAIKDDDYPDGVSIVNGAVLTMTGCTMTDAEYEYGQSLIDGNEVVDYGENSSYIIVDGKRLVCNPASLEYALKNGNAILMENNITVEAHLTKTSHGTNINIDGGGNELTLRGIYGVSGANVSLSNMTLVDSKTDDYTIFNQGGKIELNNVTYNSTINMAFQMAGGGDVVLTDCNISGDVTGDYAASNIWCGDGRNVTVNGGTYGSIFMNAQYHSGWPAASAHAASKITLNDGTITKLILETELGAEGYYVSATLTQNGGTITNLVENPQNLDLTGRSQYNK